uniref:Uncharacterized protein n=1 Tax=Oryza rufipogon TaxID=4529 RepID=A0A0E0P7V0_ORYRU
MATVSAADPQPKSSGRADPPPVALGAVDPPSHAIERGGGKVVRQSRQWWRLAHRLRWRYPTTACDLGHLALDVCSSCLRKQVGRMQRSFL